MPEQSKTVYDLVYTAFKEYRVWRSIRARGTLQSIADTLGVSHTAVLKMKHRGCFPLWSHQLIMDSKPIKTKDAEFRVLLIQKLLKTCIEQSKPNK